MRPLNVLICGADKQAMQEIAEVFASDGVQVETSTHPIDALEANIRKWDYLLIDLDGMNSFLRSLIPAICHKFPSLPVIGFSLNSNADNITFGNGFRLDFYLDRVPQAEDLIVAAPQVAAKYLCDTGTLRAIKTAPLTSR